MVETAVPIFLPTTRDVTHVRGARCRRGTASMIPVPRSRVPISYSRSWERVSMPPYAAPPSYPTLTSRWLSVSTRRVSSLVRAALQRRTLVCNALMKELSRAVVSVFVTLPAASGHVGGASRGTVRDQAHGRNSRRVRHGGLRICGSAVTRWVAANGRQGPEPVKSAGALTLSRRACFRVSVPDPPHERSRNAPEALPAWIDAVQERVGQLIPPSSRWPWCLSSSSTWCKRYAFNRGLGLHAGAGVAPVRGELSPGRGVHDALRRARGAWTSCIRGWSLRKRAWPISSSPSCSSFRSVFLVIYTATPFIRNSFHGERGLARSGRCARAVGAEVRHHHRLRAARSAGVSETIKNFYVAMGWEEPEVRVKEIH